MAFSHTVSYSVAASSGTLSRSKSYTGSSQVEVSESVADSETDYDIVVAIDVSAVKSFYIVSDQTVTVETNSGSEADDTLSLVAGVPYVWNTDSYDSFQLGTDVTVLYVTNASGSTANIELRCVMDATP